MSFFTSATNSVAKRTNYFARAAAGTASGALAGAPGGWLGSAIGATVGLGTALLSNWQAKKNRQANEDLAEKQFQQNKEMWTLQNQYNTPSMQAARLKSAGLNSALAYGGSGQLVGNADTAPQLDYAGAMSTPAFNFDSSIQAGLSARQLVSQLRVNDSTVRSNDASAEQAHMNAVRTSELLPEEKRQIQSNIMLNSAKEAESYKHVDELEQAIQESISRVHLNEEQTVGAKLLNYITDQSKEDQIKAYTIKNKHEEAQIREINKKMSVYDAQIREIASQINVNFSQSRLNDANTTRSYTESDQILAYTEVLGKESKQLDEVIRKAAAEANISEKDARWYVFDKIKDTVLGTAEVAVKAYTGAAFAGAAAQNAAASTMRAKTYNASEISKHNARTKK